MPQPQLVATTWSSAGDVSPVDAVRDLLFDAADALAPAVIEIGSQNGPDCSAAKAFNLRGLVSLLRDKGFDGQWGVEILSASFRQLPVSQALKLAAESTLTVL
jgi:hypothetical protein